METGEKGHRIFCDYINVSIPIINILLTLLPDVTTGNKVNKNMRYFNIANSRYYENKTTGWCGKGVLIFKAGGPYVPQVIKLLYCGVFFHLIASFINSIPQCTYLYAWQYFKKVHIKMGFKEKFIFMSTSIWNPCIGFFIFYNMFFPWMFEAPVLFWTAVNYWIAFMFVAIFSL